MNRYSVRVKREIGKRRHLFAVSVSVLMVLGAFNCLLNGIRGEEPGNNDWVIEIGDSVSWTSEDGNVHLDGDLYVEGYLDLSDIALTIDCMSDGEFQIYVAEQGSLTINNCIITTGSNQHRFKFKVYGSMTISSSTISNLWGDADDHTGGIQIYNSNVHIQDCTFSDLEVGVYVNRAYPTIENNNFENCECGIISDSESATLPPDFYLDPSKITFSDDTPIIGDEIQISADIKNIGDRQAFATVRFYDGNPAYGYTNQIGIDQTALILGTETRTFQVNWVAVGGNRDIWVVVNEDQTVLEPSYTNNIGKKSIDPTLMLTVRKLDLSQGCQYSPLSGTAVTVCKSTGESIGLTGNTDSEGSILFSLILLCEIQVGVSRFKTTGILPMPVNDCILSVLPR